MTIQLEDGGMIGRTILTDGDTQLYATKLDGNGFSWRVTQGYAKMFESKIFSKALSVYQGLAREVFVS